MTLSKGTSKIICSPHFLRTSILFLLLLPFFCSAQTDTSKGYTLYVNQPFGLSTKLRFSLEKSVSEHYSLLLYYTNFYGLVPGVQSYLELRRYNPNKKDFFVYTKVGAGNSFKTNTVYGIFGIGVGEKIYFDKKQRFSIVCIQGVKACPNVIGDENPDTATGGLGGLFFLIGPGSIIDLNFNLGYKF